MKNSVFPGRLALHALVVAAGFAALSWEVIWQLKAALALGVSAIGTAITLAATMGGMSVGSLAIGRYLRDRQVMRPLRLYAACEALIGFSGLALPLGFSTLEQFDTKVYAVAPSLATLLHVLGITLVLGPPTLAMGATVPILGLVARQSGTTLPRLYGLNTAGAAAGCLFLSFTLLPKLGVLQCSRAVAGLNLLVSVLAWALAGQMTDWEREMAATPEPVALETSLAHPELAVFLTGLITFSLEVAWFRALRAVLWSTSESFAIMLAAVLVSLAAGAAIAPWLRRRGARLEMLIGAAGVLVLAATPAIERFDAMVPLKGGFLQLMLSWFGLTLAIIGLPVMLAGLVLPWLLDSATGPRQWSRLYFVNTVGAVVGSLGTAWLALPALGFTHTSWMAGLLLIALAAWQLESGRRWGVLSAGALALFVAFVMDTGIGKTRVLGRFPFKSYRTISSVDTPDANISLLRTEGGDQVVIDGFVAADTTLLASHYMPWMGRLPMLLHPDPKKALVICFGTGQTTNAVRREGVEQLDVVDLNRRVLELGPRIQANENVLADPRVRTIVMDGRAWMRRTTEQYDVITLEPMPPNFSGVNGLYDREFYQAARARLRKNGVIAQWLPFHLVPAYHSTSIVRTFWDSFPNSALWIDPLGFTGILVGSTSDKPVAEDLPGFRRAVPRDLDEAQVRRSFILDAPGMARLAALGDVITDDNQILNHNHWRLTRQDDQGAVNVTVVDWASSDPPPATPGAGTIFKKLRLRPEDLKPIPPYSGGANP